MKKLRTSTKILTRTLVLPGLALMLAIGTAPAIAAGKHGDRHPGAGQHHNSGKHVSISHNYRVGKGHRGGSHYRNRGYQPRYYGGYRHHGRGHHRRYQSSYYFSPRPYYSPYFGAALVVGALTHSLYHHHDGAVCYDSHENGYRNGGRDRNYSEAVGCHRIERLDNGTERRVEVPISECN